MSLRKKCPCCLQEMKSVGLEDPDKYTPNKCAVPVLYIAERYDCSACDFKIAIIAVID